MNTAPEQLEPLSSLLSLEGRTALVTGGGSGIGRATAKRFAEAGANVLVADVNVDAAAAVAAEIGSASGQIEPAQLDICDEAAVIRVLDDAEQRFGGVDLVVNAAGIYPLNEVLTTPTDEFDRVFEVNVRALFVVSREAARRMSEGGRRGVIVNLASGAGAIRSYPEVAAHYSSSKAAVAILTQQMAIEFGPLGIRVLAIAPGVTATEGVKALDDEGIFRERISQSNPLRRVCDPDEIARTALYCASELSSAVTGAVIAVDCGQIL
jgi:NAD(P)-dependent dehydrogenase (short-subunit alcohol dehydrogenase family)